MNENAKDALRVDSLERFARKKLGGGFGSLSADQQALYADIVAVVDYTHRLEAAIDAQQETAPQPKPRGRLTADAIHRREMHSTAPRPDF